MPTPREEREALLENDDGDMDDLVTTPSNGRICHIRYHDDPDCYQLSRIEEDNIRTWTRKKARIRGRVPCRICVLNEEIDNTPDNEHGCRSALEVAIANGDVPDELLGAGGSA